MLASLQFGSHDRRYLQISPTAEKQQAAIHTDLKECRYAYFKATTASAMISGVMPGILGSALASLLTRSVIKAGREDLGRPAFRAAAEISFGSRSEILE